MNETKSEIGKTLLEEWKECRSTIARFDQVIVDVRKYGFSIITGLLTADTFLFVKIPGLSSWEKAGVSLVMTVLIFALFTVDRCYEILLRGAVQRAEEIENELGMGLSIEIAHLVRLAKTDTWGRELYSWFVWAGALPALITILPVWSKIDDVDKLALFIVILATIIFWIKILIYDSSKKVSQHIK
jgi:hypothetical protein